MGALNLWASVPDRISLVLTSDTSGSSLGSNADTN